jgi:hypothetical protein
MGVERRLNELRGLAKVYAKAKAEQSYLEEFKKSKLADLMKEAEQNGYSTAAAQEREARANEEYKSLLVGLREATYSAELSRWELKISEWGVDLWRTEQATKRAEMRGYGS